MQNSWFPTGTSSKVCEPISAILWWVVLRHNHLLRRLFHNVSTQCAHLCTFQPVQAFTGHKDQLSCYFILRSLALAEGGATFFLHFLASPRPGLFVFCVPCCCCCIPGRGVPGTETKLLSCDDFSLPIQTNLTPIIVNNVNITTTFFLIL